MKNLTGKHVAITGVGSGIGLELALLFARRRCNLALNELSGERLQETIDLCKRIYPDIRIYAESFDVSNEDSMHNWAKKSIEELGHIDIMINNAGVAIGQVKAEELTKKDFDWIMGINFWGMVYGTQAFVPHLKTRPESAIVNVSSLLGLIGIAYQAAYCTTKFAIRGFTECLRMEVLNDAPQLTVHTVHPGGVSTNIANDSKEIGDKVKNQSELDKVNAMLSLPPSKAAEIIADHIKRKKHRIIVGKDARQSDWIQRLWPEKYTKMLFKQFGQFKVNEV